MTNEEIHNIEVGDRIYVDRKIHKRIFNGDWFMVYKPDKFYAVFEVDKTKTLIRLITGSELGLNKIIAYRSANVKVPLPIPLNYMQHFNLVKKKDYQEIINVDYFAGL